MPPENTINIKKQLNVKAIMPDTTKDFQCIMSACEDNCCRNTTWAITVDPAAYKKYKELCNETGRRILECIEDTGTMLKFKEFDDGKCPLMLESGLCYIHKELGAEFLCRTCATYPRVNNAFNRTGFDTKVAPYVNSKPRVFENYLMYALMSSRFLADSNDYASCFAGFAVELVTMLTFACMFHSSDSFGDEEMVVAMYLFHRRVSHSPVLRKKLAEQFTDNLLVFLVNVLGGIK